jgi:hypothetical protein
MKERTLNLMPIAAIFICSRLSRHSPARDSEYNVRDNEAIKINLKNFFFDELLDDLLSLSRMNLHEKENSAKNFSE